MAMKELFATSFRTVWYGLGSFRLGNVPVLFPRVGRKRIRARNWGNCSGPPKITAAHLQSRYVSLGVYRDAVRYQQRPAPAIQSPAGDMRFC